MTHSLRHSLLVLCCAYMRTRRKRQSKKVKKISAVGCYWSWHLAYANLIKQAFKKVFGGQSILLAAEWVEVREREADLAPTLASMWRHFARENCSSKYRGCSWLSWTCSTMSPDDSICSSRLLMWSRQLENKFDGRDLRMVALIDWTPRASSASKPQYFWFGTKVVREKLTPLLHSDSVICYECSVWCLIERRVKIWRVHPEWHHLWPAFR